MANGSKEPVLPVYIVALALMLHCIRGQLRTQLGHSDFVLRALAARKCGMSDKTSAATQRNKQP